MFVDQGLAEFSDLAYKTAVVVYLVALAVSLFFYGQMKMATDARRQRSEFLSKARRDAAGASGTAGGGGSTAGSDAAGSGEGSGSSVATAVTTATATAPARPGTGDAGTGGPPVDSGEAGDIVEEDLPPHLHIDMIRRRFRRADSTGGMAQALVWLAVALHIAFVVLRGLAAQRFPWGNLFEYIAVVSMVAMIIACAVIRRRSMRVMWPWILTPIVLLLFYSGTELYADVAPVVPSLKSNWYWIHVSTVSVGGGIGLVSGMASLMYLLRRSQPKGKEKGVLGAIATPLPDAAKLDALAYRAGIWTLPVFGLGIVFGAIWAHFAWDRFWGWDPKETVSFITWILYAAYLHARATPGMRGRFAAVINVLAFATMVFNLFFINMVVSGLHSYAGLN